MIITAYRTKKISDDHPYIWRYTARRALVIFDHPYNADYAFPANYWNAAMGERRISVMCCPSTIAKADMSAERRFVNMDIEAGRPPAITLGDGSRR